jgi:S1 RNA binding domain protein
VSLPGNPDAETVVNAALDQVGVDYAWGGGDANGATEGFGVDGWDPLDCLARATTLADCAVTAPLDRHSVDAAYVTLAATDEQVHTVDFNPMICPDNPVCAPVIDGTVARITPYGAFLQLEDGRLGLVHISEVDRNYVKDVHDHLREGDVVQAKVVAIKEDGKIDLSIKALQDPAPPRARRGSDPEFEQMLKKFMRQSEERLVDYKRAVEHKRK